MKIVLTKTPKVQGLLTKDMLHLRRFKRIIASYIFLFTIAAILLFITDRSIWLTCLLPIIITVGAGIFALSSFSYDENTKIDMYVKSLPLTVKEIIGAKYVFVIFLTIIGTVVGLLLTAIIFTFFIRTTISSDHFEILIISIAGTFCVSLLEAIQIPCIYKFGAEKANMQIYSIIVVLVIVLVLLVGGIFYWIELLSLSRIGIESLLPILLIGLIAIAYNVSYKVSCRLYEKQE